MAEKRTCDHCGLPITEHDAGAMPVMLRSAEGIMIQVSVLSGPDGARPMVRVGCVKTLIQNAAVVFPKIASVDESAEVVNLPEQRTARGVKS